MRVVFKKRNHHNDRDLIGLITLELSYQWETLRHFFLTVLASKARSQTFMAILSMCAQEEDIYVCSQSISVLFSRSSPSFTNVFTIPS